MKPFLKKFAQVGGIVALALVLGIGVSVFADNYVGAPAFPQNAPTPLNILGDVAGAQSKGDARLILPSTDPYAQMPLGKQNFAGSTLSLWGSTFVGKNLNVFGAANTGDLTVGQSGVLGNSRVGNIFGKLFINNDTTSPSAGIKVGGDGTAGTLASTLRAALDIDLTGRTLNSSQAGVPGADAVSVKSAVGAISSAFITNSQVFHFYSDLISKDARIWAGSIKLSEYSPAAGKILASGDAEGNAVWSTFDAGETKVVHVSTVDRDTGNPRINKAYCPTGYVAIGGGGDCEHGDIRISRPITGTPNAADYTWNTQYETRTDTGAGQAATMANGWMINCGNDNSDGDIHVDVMCIKITKPTLTVPTPTSVTSVGGGTTSDPNPNASWKTLTGGVTGSVGQSCNDWLPTTGQAGTQGVRAQYLATGAILPNKCAYMGSSGCILGNASLAPQGARPVAACLELFPGGNEIRTQTYR